VGSGFDGFPTLPVAPVMKKVLLGVTAERPEVILREPF
jgi:hypothetical protein